MPRLVSTDPPAAGLTPDQRLRQVLSTAEPLGRARRALDSPTGQIGTAPASATPARPSTNAVPSSGISPSSGTAPWEFDDDLFDPDQPDSATASDDAAIASPDDAVPDFKSRAKQFAANHLAALGLVLAIVLTFAVFQTTRAHSEPVPIQLEPASSPSQHQSQAASDSTAHKSASAEVTATARPQIRVHVMGEVVRPGVVSLELGARVIDAIDAAGGPNSAADLGELNLAAPVADGAQIIVGGPARPGSTMRADDQTTGPSSNSAKSADQAAGDASKVNLNSANQAQLESLPGVGPVTAKAILAWRSEHGKFTRIEELQEVNGIGAKTYAQIAPYVTV